MVDTIAPPETLYDADFHAWTLAQAAALRAAARAGANLPVDWENVAEEIESLGRSDVRALRSRIEPIIEHLLKLEFAPARQPRAAWVRTVDRSRSAFAKLIAESPSLLPQVARWVAAEHAEAARQVTRDLAPYGELTPQLAASIAARRYTPDEVLGDWFPPR